jgi:cholesterol oxidase
VIGSGFGGSVAALRLSEKGYRVRVLEKGARWRLQDHPSNSSHVRKYLWQKYFSFIGPMQITILKNVVIQSAVGVGGGSLIYGNVLYEANEQFTTMPNGPRSRTGRRRLAPHYDQAKRVRGVARNPRLTPSDDIFKSIAADLAVVDTFHPAQAGVFFGEPGKTVPDRTSLASDQTAPAASSARSA